MCCGCWKEAGEPKIDTPAVRALLPLVEAVYAHSCVGGNLHIVLDDTNVEDEHLDFCQGEIDKGVAPAEQLAAEQVCLTALRALTFQERASALGLRDGCWEGDRS